MMELPAMPTLPVSYVRRTGIAGSSDSIAREWIEYFRGFSTDIVFSRGLRSAPQDGKEIGDICNRRPEVAGYNGRKTSVHWQICASMAPTSHVCRIHGRSVGEPGILLPANAEILQVRSSQGRKAELVYARPSPGSVAVFHDRTSPHRGSGIPLCGLSGYRAGYLLASIMRNSRRTGESSYTVPWNSLYSTDTYGVSVSRHGETAEICIAQPMARFAEQLFLGKLPNLLLGLDFDFWTGFSARLTESSMTFGDPCKAASVMKALCRAGYGHSVAHAYSRYTHIRTPSYRRLRKVESEILRLPLTISVPQTTEPCVHMQGIVFRLPEL